MMAYKLNQLLEELEQIDQTLIQDIVPIAVQNPEAYRGCTTLAKITIEVNGEPTVVTVGFPDSYPNKLPKFFDKDDEFGVIPHKELDGFLCFTRSESLVIDERFPASVLLNCVEKVLMLIEQGIRGENDDDYIVEFEDYWRRESKCKLYGCIDTDNHTVRMLNLWSKSSNDDPILVAAESDLNLEQAIYSIFGFNLDEAKKYRCIYFPLKPGTFFKPPLGETWDFSTVKENIITNLTPSNKSRFQRILKQTPNNVLTNIEIIVVGLPLPNGNVALFGYIMSGNAPIRNNGKKAKVMRRIHPLVQRPKELGLLETEVKRWHPKHLLNRTGGNTGLSDKHVAIVGVGSIGSEVAMKFAKAGVNKISLIDPDFLELDNVHRHTLGSNKVYALLDSGLVHIPKVWGIKQEVNQKYPFTKIEDFPDYFSVVWKEKKINWTNVDLVVIAIGEPNQEMLINKGFHQLDKTPPVLYTWVEPLGIGGHTLVTLNEEYQGCYQCLFKSEEDIPIFNRSAFAKPFQEFSKSITGCASIFTPYNFLDSERTAILTVDTGIKALMGQLHGNPLLSWKGDNHLFASMGYKTTRRYSFSEKKLFESRLLYKDPECPICSKKEEK
ncbi:hypothetical protein OBCHQ24_12550 [Oceanobacillus iheyensis]|nr:hypothetical protein OBCHQ24_12550 [Oceanobacillus iheyensis]